MLESVDTLIAFVLIMLVVSLLITIVVQMLAALLNLRGLNLLSGLRRTFAVIAPGLEQDTKALAQAVVKGRLVSDSFLPDLPGFRWWRHAAAVRPGEVFDAIHRIAIGKKLPDNATLRQYAQDLLVALGVDKTALEKAAKQITEVPEEGKRLAEVAKTALQSIPDEAVRHELQVAVDAAVNTVTTELRTVRDAAAEKAKAAAVSIDIAYEKFQYWTDICQERVQQWFTMHTRVATVVFACLFAFALQLDTVEIFKLVSSNRAVRDKLVGQVAAITTQADKIFRESKSVLQTAFDAWPAKSDPNVQAALASNNVTVEPNDTRETLTRRIEAALRSIPDNEVHLKSFNKALDDAALATLKERAGDYRQVKTDLDKTGFALFPENSKGRWGTGWCKGSKEHFWGILFSVGLLSLGAPFWYNVLRNLASLRSTVAQHIAEEKEQQRHPTQSRSLGVTQQFAPELRAAVSAPPTTK